MVFARFSSPRGAGPTGAVLLLALALSACTATKPPALPTPTPAATAPNAEARDYAQYTELQWSDDFNGAGPVDATKWGYDTGGGGWGNNELETYTTSPDNVLQSGGNLVIQAIRQPAGTASPSYTSGRILTKGKQSFQYGRLDVRARLPQGQGVWPAIWLLGSDIDQTGWPACGEIDLLELRGQEPTKLLTTLHFGTSAADHRYKGIDNIKLPSGASFADDFHVFSVVRSQDQLRFYLDGNLYYTFTASDASPYPFNNPFFVVLNVAVGGNFLGSPDGSTTFPQQLLVDYVRYYQYK